MAGVNVNQFLENIIQPTLLAIGMDSDKSRKLLLCTAAHESHLGRYVKQVNGPALGPYQMEPATYVDIWDNYISYRPDMSERLLTKFGYVVIPPADRLITDFAWATAMARIHYYRVKEVLPDANDIIAISEYWKKYYNSTKGKGTKERFIADYYKFIVGGKK